MRNGFKISKKLNNMLFSVQKVNSYREVYKELRGVRRS